jgi:hypothetical protein
MAELGIWCLPFDYPHEVSASASNLSFSKWLPRHHYQLCASRRGSKQEA